jgi:cytochrome c556
LRRPLRFFRAIGRLTLIVALVGTPSRAALCQDRSASSVKDEIFACKILMDTLDSHMDDIDWMLHSGKPIDLSQTFDHADTISVMVMAFPHLFPPDTNQWQPNAKRDPARDTFASPDIWTNFSDFYQQAAAASRLAFDASRAKREGDFRKTMATLRTACDSCHALYVKADQ